LDVICPAIVLLEVKMSKIAHRVICGAKVEMSDWSVDVVASRRRILGALVVVVAGLKLGVPPVPAIRCNMPPTFADLTLGALAATVGLTATTVISAIAAIILVTTGGLTVVGGGVALSTIWATIASVARARLIGAGLARSTSRVIGSVRPARVRIEVGMRDGIRRGGPVCRLILLLLKSLKRHDVRVKFIIGHGRVTEHKSRCDGFKFFSKFDDDVVDELVVG
jgi:hypothetical protein